VTWSALRPIPRWRSLMLREAGTTARSAGFGYALMESMIGFVETEVMARERAIWTGWRWVQWHKHDRLHSAVGAPHRLVYEQRFQTRTP
jgi:hypothetical protein